MLLLCAARESILVWYAPLGFALHPRAAHPLREEFKYSSLSHDHSILFCLCSVTVAAVLEYWLALVTRHNTYTCCVGTRRAQQTARRLHCAAPALRSARRGRRPGGQARRTQWLCARRLLNTTGSCEWHFKNVQVNCHTCCSRSYPVLLSHSLCQKESVDHPRKVRPATRNRRANRSVKSGFNEQKPAGEAEGLGSAPPLGLRVPASLHEIP